MLIILDERWKAGMFPPGDWFHLIHLGPEFRVLCFLMSMPNRVWGSMGPPCLTYLVSYNSSGGPSCFYICNVCVCWWYPSCLQTTLGQGDMFLCWPILTG